MDEALEGHRVTCRYLPARGGRPWKGVGAHTSPGLPLCRCDHTPTPPHPHKNAHATTGRLVILPHESHGYRGRESIMHTLYEMDAWLQRYCEEDAGAEAPPPAAEGDKVEEVVLPAAVARAEEVP